MNPNSLSRFAMLCIASTIVCASSSYAQAPATPYPWPFANFEDAKAQQAQKHGSFHYGVVTERINVTDKGQKTPLPQGYVVKVVGASFDNRPDAVVCYITVQDQSWAFSLPRTAVSLVQSSSPQWSQAQAKYQQQVEAIETGLRQNTTEPPQQATQAPPEIPVSALTKNDRIRMLYVLRDEKFISSIRAGEYMPDEQLLSLYTKALEQRRLRGIESAIRNLQR